MNTHYFNGGWNPRVYVCQNACPKRVTSHSRRVQKKLNALPLVATTNSSDTSAMLTFKVGMTLRTTFDGRNPAPPGMVKTL